jgi:hypothetical protein
VSPVCVDLERALLYILYAFEVLDLERGQLKGLVDEQNVLLRDRYKDVLVLLAVQRLRIVR